MLYPILNDRIKYFISRFLERSKLALNLFRFQNVFLSFFVVTHI